MASFAVWLFRVNSLDERRTQLAEPYAAEISGQWRSAADAWKELGCPYEHATVLALYGSETEKRQALTVFESLGASPARGRFANSFGPTVSREFRAVHALRRKVINTA